MGIILSSREDRWKSRLQPFWDPGYPRPKILPNDSIGLAQYRHVYCSDPPDPYPEWLASSGITPQEWRNMVWAITCYAIDSVARTGMYDNSDLSVALPRHSAAMKKYLDGISPVWAKRGLRIVYHEVPVTNLRHGRGSIINADMDNWIEFSSMSSPIPVHAPEGTSKPGVAATNLSPTTPPMFAPNTAASMSLTIPSSTSSSASTVAPIAIEGRTQLQKFCCDCGASLVTQALPVARFCPSCGCPSQSNTGPE